MTTQNNPTEYLYPDTWTNLTNKGSNFASGMFDQTNSAGQTTPGFLNNVYNNWYGSQPGQQLSTGVTPYLNQAYGAMMNPSDQWTNGIESAQGLNQQGVGALGQVNPMLNAAGSQFNTSSQYDPSQLNQFLNPYLSGANQATINQSNRNLTENILPAINSSFTGAGQFGSSRNADFNNRAIRDQQQALTDSLAKSNSVNYSQANQTYSDWANRGMQAGSGLAGLANQQAALGQGYGNLANNAGNLAGAGANLDQQQIQNMLTAATSQQGVQQAGLDKSYQDWMTRQNFPISGLSAMGTYISNASRGTQPNVSIPVTQPDDVSRVMAAISAMSSSLDSSTVQNLLGILGFTFPDTVDTMPAPNNNPNTGWVGNGGASDGGGG